MATKHPPTSIFGISWRTIVIGALVLIGIAVLSQRIDIDDVHEYASRLNPIAAFALLTVLPLLGFPVTVLHVAMGIRFEAPLALTLVAISIVLQLLASFALVHTFRAKFARRLDQVRQRIPRTAHGSMCLFTMLLPGVPYFAKNYVLPLLGVPLRTYLLVCAPIHIIRSSVAIMLGDQSDDLTPGRIVGLAIYFSLTLLASWWMFRRLRAQVGSPRPRARASHKPKTA